MPEPLPDSVVVENGKCNRGFPDPTSANESNWAKVFNEINRLLD